MANRSVKASSVRRSLHSALSQELITRTPAMPGGNGGGGGSRAASCAVRADRGAADATTSPASAAAASASSIDVRNSVADLRVVRT
jgi:hypothetical protein